MTEKITYTYEPETVQVNNVDDPVQKKVEELETEIMAGQKKVDFKAVTNALAIDIKFKGNTVKTAAALINESHDEFVKTIESALVIRKNFFDEVIPQRENEPVVENERLNALAYRQILDNAKQGSYNGTGEIMQKKAEFYLASFLSGVDNSLEGMQTYKARVERNTLSSSGDIFSNDSANETP